MNRQSRFDAGYRMLGAGAQGWPREMVWRFRIKNMTLLRLQRTNINQRALKWRTFLHWSWASLVAQLFTCNMGDLGLIPGLGRSPGKGKGYPLQYSGLENSIDSTVHRVAKSRRRLRDFHFTSTSIISSRQNYWHQPQICKVTYLLILSANCVW